MNQDHPFAMNESRPLVPPTPEVIANIKTIQAAAAAVSNVRDPAIARGILVGLGAVFTDDHNFELAGYKLNMKGPKGDPHMTRDLRARRKAAKAARKARKASRC